MHRKPWEHTFWPTVSSIIVNVGTSLGALGLTGTVVRLVAQGMELQAATGTQRQIPVGPVAEFASVERSVAFGLRRSTEKAFGPVGQVCR